MFFFPKKRCDPNFIAAGCSLRPILLEYLFTSSRPPLLKKDHIPVLVEREVKRLKERTRAPSLERAPSFEKTNNRSLLRKESSRWLLQKNEEENTLDGIDAA